MDEPGGDLPAEDAAVVDWLEDRVEDLERESSWLRERVEHLEQRVEDLEGRIGADE